jgi:hypothetical protein
MARGGKSEQTKAQRNFSMTSLGGNEEDCVACSQQ